MKTVPIVIFTYRRNIDELITSLLLNNLSKESDLYIFSDGFKNDIDKKDVLAVRENLKRINGFRTIKIIESQQNKGLANSVIEGVSSIFEQSEKVIVLEDDLIVSDNFLTFMNQSLDFYKEEENIWSISGYTPDLECLSNYEKDIFLALRANSWGWATWKNRWEKIDWDINDWDSFKKDSVLINKFNRGGDDLFKMLEVQMLGKIDSWAIRWCYNQFKYNSFTIYPTKSRVVNIGFDSKGTHNSDGSERWDTQISNEKINLETVVIDDNIISCFAKKYNLKNKTKIGYFLKKYGGYKMIRRMFRYVR